MNKTIIKSLEKIYSQIQNFKCQQCHQCCGPIIWFKPEEILIKEYMNDHNLTPIVWTTEEFKRHQMKCPYLEQHTCLIYPVRPIVCRLQGVISDLPCRITANAQPMNKDKITKIYTEFVKLIKQTNGMHTFYTTHKI